MRKISIDKLCWRSGKRELISNEHLVRNSALTPSNTPIRLPRAAAQPLMVFFLPPAIVPACHNEAASPAKPPIAVRLADVTQYQLSEGLRYSASLIPYAQVDVAFRTTGYVTDVKQIKSADSRTRNIGTGDHVTRGTVLAQIRHQDLKNQADESGAQVDVAVAQHAQAEQDFNRAKALYATQSLTKPEYDQAQARFDSSLAAVNQAQAAQRQAQLTLSDSQLEAPLSGYILARNIDVGTWHHRRLQLSPSPIRVR